MFYDVFYDVHIDALFAFASRGVLVCSTGRTRNSSTIPCRPCVFRPWARVGLCEELAFGQSGVALPADLLGRSPRAAARALWLDARTNQGKTRWVTNEAKRWTLG